MKPYEAYVSEFNQFFGVLLGIAPSVDSVNDLVSEEEELEFVKAFRELLRVRNILQSFADFSFDDLSTTEQNFEDYKSKYLDIYDKVKTSSQKELVSILDDVDFELELIHRDEINVSYILKLLARLKDLNLADLKKQKKAILDIVSGDIELRSKKELIEKFIEVNLPKIAEADDVEQAFEDFWSKEQQEAFTNLCKEEGLDPNKTQQIISEYLFTEREPLNDDIVGGLKVKPKILERKVVIDRVKTKVIEFVKTFIEGM